MGSNYVIITTDTHAGLPPEQYRDWVEPQFREAFDEAAALESAMREELNLDAHKKFLAEWNKEIGDHGGMAGAWDVKVRQAEMDRFGIAGEVIFPDADAAGVGGVAKTPFNAGLGMTGDNDPVLVTAGALAHNRWLADFCSYSPERRAGVAVIPVPHDIDKSIKEVEAVAAAGLRGGVMIPAKWGTQLPYGDHHYDPLWEACASLGLPVTTHSGVGPDDYGITPGLTSIYATEAYWWAARPLWALILGGVFERHPTLRYVLAENGAWWVPDIITRMDSKWLGDHATRKFGPAVFRAELTMKPSEYLNRNCWFAASVMGPVEVERRREIGIGNLMWGDDFPHPEGSWPHTDEWIRDRMGTIPEEDSRRILGLNAVELYRFDLDALAPTVERIGPTPEDIRGPLHVPPDPAEAATTHSISVRA
jgi:predicted TIM-barrel fold metal-dependent hydrolase